MRKLADIRTALTKLRFKDGIPLAQIGRDANCSIKQLLGAFNLEASETVWRRLDAYLDAGNLHQVTSDSKRCARIERLTQELYRVYKLRTIPMRDVYLMPPERQKRLEQAMNWRLKKALRETIKKKFGEEIWIQDSDSYFRSKARLAARYGNLAP